MPMHVKLQRDLLLSLHSATSKRMFEQEWASESIRRMNFIKQVQGILDIDLDLVQYSSQ